MGANLGYFCHKLEDLGFASIASEFLPDVAYAADVIRKAEGKTFRVVQGDILDPTVYEPLIDTEFDIVLALNIFHHFTKTQRSFERFETWLNRIRLKEMFFETNRQDEAPRVAVS